MSHTIRDKAKLLARVRRIKGQCEAIERALEAENECGETLQLIAGARGAMNGLMAEVLEQHVVSHVLNGPTSRARDEAAGELVDVVRAYLK
jgi:DNA-binding FrmR family transcriptional regulator